MYPEQQRLMPDFCYVILAANPSISHENSFLEDAGGEKICQYNKMHEICNFRAKVIVESVFFFHSQYSQNYQDF